AMLHRASGSPRVAGSSQAAALISTTSSGGKNPGPSGARAFLQTGQTLVEEALAPHADDFPARVETASDLIVGEAFGGEEDHLRAHNKEIRQRILDRPGRELPRFAA